MFEGEKSVHHVYGIVLAIIAVVALGGIVYMVSSADDVGQSVTITTSAPTLETVTVKSGASCAAGTTLNTTDSKFSLVEASTTNEVHVCGTVADLNGYGEIDADAQYDLVLYDDLAVNADCTANDNNCYIQNDGSGITLANCTSGTTCDFDFEVADIAYLANPTIQWKAKVTVTDDAAQSVNTTSSAFAINPLLAFGVSTPVSFGSVGLGNTSTQQTVTFTNSGNVVVDAEQTATSAASTPGDMVCTNGSISVGAVEYSFTDQFSYGAGTDLQGATPLTISALNLAKSTVTLTPETQAMYLLLTVPATGVGGSCSNTVTFTAIPAA